MAKTENSKSLQIRNSTAEFLIFQIENRDHGVEVYYKDENIWCTQKAMAALFDVGVPAISKHLKNVFEEGELVEDSVISKMETTASDGKKYLTNYYNLDATIAVGYRVNSRRATEEHFCRRRTTERISMSEFPTNCNLPTIQSAISATHFNPGY